MPLYSWEFVLTVACTLGWTRAPEFKGWRGAVLGSVSAGVSLCLWLGLHGGVGAICLGQLGLVLVVVAVRVIRNE